MNIDRSACPSPRLHGDESAYRYGCRCPDARELERLRKKRRREGRSVSKLTSSVGTTRRLQALAAIGWPREVLAAEIGMNEGSVKDLRINRRARFVCTSTARRVAEVYERLSGTAGPSPRTRGHARRQGWAPPLLWEDVDIDDPNAQPAVDEPEAAGPKVRLDEVDHLLGFGYSLETVAARFDVLPESIKDIRRRATRRGVAA